MPKTGNVILQRKSQQMKLKTILKKIRRNGTNDVVTEFCIMPKSTKYSTKRTKKFCERHEAIIQEHIEVKALKMV